MKSYSRFESSQNRGEPQPRRAIRLRVIGCLAVVSSLLMVMAMVSGQTAVTFAAATGVNWPTFRLDSFHDGFNTQETTIGVSNVTGLQQAWVGAMGNLVDGSSAAVVDGVVYIGSTDHNLYAFNANGCGQGTCRPLWFGHTQNGIFSSPAVANGVVYVGRNNGTVAAYDAAGCGKFACLPRIQLPIENEDIVSSSPTIVNGTVYVGSADQFAAPIGRLYVYTLPAS